MNFLPRDFIETSEALVFAVVDSQPEDGKVLSFLRYGPMGKLATEAANSLLREQYPQYLHESTRLDAVLHAVPIANILRHHRPRQRLSEMRAEGAADIIEQKLLRLVDCLTSGGLPAETLGVTGSILIGRHTLASDLDVVVYGRENFFAARKLAQDLIQQGRLNDLDANAWREAYTRRGGELEYAEFVRHERRKGNKGMIAGSKFDLALIVEKVVEEVDEPIDEDQPPIRWRKTDKAKIRATVLDDVYSFDQPARYLIDHPEITEVQSFTHTYTGQALTGEIIEASGSVETADDGRKRLIVGSSREAPGEFIRVVGNARWWGM